MNFLMDGARRAVAPAAPQRRRVAVLLASLLIASCAFPVCAEGQKSLKEENSSWRGVVTYVTDGDTLWVRPEEDGPPRKLRLDGIDAPEICQAHGPAAREALAQRLLHREVRVNTRSMDDYQRALATVTVQGDDVAAWMVNHGHAWSYRYRKDPGRYATQEKRARAQGVGLFARSDAVRPREFRKRHGSCYDSTRPGKASP
jgi:endonuclease YncB( thermonuclease family)